MTAPVLEAHPVRAGRATGDRTTAPASAGATPGTRPTSRIDWRAYTFPASGGHLLWDGPARHDRPELPAHSRKIAIRRIAFADGRRRQPVGPVIPTCGEGLCLRSEHLADTADRQNRYRAIAVVTGQPTSDGTCRNGHPWAEHAVFNARGGRACSACRHGDQSAVDDIAVTEALRGRQLMLARPERLEVARLLTARGVSAREISDRVGASSRTVVRWRSARGWTRVEPP